MDAIKVGIVGIVGRGGALIEAFQKNQYTSLDAICDIDEEGVNNSAKELGVSKVYTDYETMLNESGIDAVVIGTPMQLHAEQSIMALERGIHVMCEVTAAVSIEEAKELVAACNKSKATYMMAENCCYLKPNVLISELIKAGLFGELYYGEGEYIHELKERNELTKWRRKWQTGINGCTYGTHSLGPIYQWMGQRVVSVSCVGSGHHYKDPRGDFYENEDSTLMLCRMEKGGLVKIRVDMLSNRPHNNLYTSIQGQTGCYEASRGLTDQPKIWLQCKNTTEEPEWMPLSDLEDEFLPEVWKNPSKEMLESGHEGSDYVVVMDFINSIHNGEKPSIGIHEAMDMTLPGLVSQESIINGSAWLPVPDSREW